MFKSTLLLDGNRGKVVSSIRRKYTKLSNKSFMKYNYLTIFYISKERGRSNFIKALTCKACKQKIKCEIKNIKAIHARAFKRNLRTCYLHFYLFMQLYYMKLLLH